MTMLTLFNFNCTYLTEIRSPEMRPLEILGGHDLVFPDISPLHILLLLIVLEMTIILFYTFIVLYSESIKGIKVTEEVETNTEPNLPGQIAGPGDMDIYRSIPRPPISKAKKVVKKIKEKVKRWIK